MTEASGDSYDLVIIGAGPTGLFAAYYAGFRGLSMAIVDSLPEPGGQVTAMYPEKMIYDVGGFAAVKGRDLVDGLVQQAAPWKPTYLLGRKAEKLETLGNGVELTLDGGETLRGRRRADHRGHRRVHPAAAARSATAGSGAAWSTSCRRCRRTPGSTSWSSAVATRRSTGCSRCTPSRPA